MNLALWIQDESLKRLVETLILALVYPLADITADLEVANVVVSDGHVKILPLLKEGKYVIQYLPPDIAERVPNVPHEYKFRYQVIVNKPKDQRAPGEPPSVGKLLSHLVLLAQKLNIT